MAPIDAINPRLTQQTAAINSYIQGGGKTPKVNPFGGGQPVEAPKKAGQGGAIPGTGEHIDKQLAFIAQNGKRTDDSEMGVNQPFKTFVKGGEQGGKFRMLS